MKAAPLALTCIILGATSPCLAASDGSSGTGFFITRDGYLLTAAHVVDSCTDFIIRGAVKPTGAVQLVAVDNHYDIALLKVNTQPPATAQLRDPEGVLRAGEAITLFGYPGMQGTALHYEVRDTKVGAVDIPINQGKFFQFLDSAEPGNSGGPVIDSSGNVVGMVEGYYEFSRFNATIGQQVRYKKSDLAISLGHLKDFLHQHGVFYDKRTSTRALNSQQVQAEALLYVAHILCR